jgi:hypothetical protein
MIKAALTNRLLFEAIKKGNPVARITFKYFGGVPRERLELSRDIPNGF